MFFRLRALHAQGIHIHLHYFSYGDRGHPQELNPYCASIHIYPRQTGTKGLSPGKPYIVQSRRDRALLERLQMDDHPVLLEGIHCTGILEELDLANRKVLVRMHNRESDYYRQQARYTRNPLKKFYFLRESRLLRAYEEKLPREIAYACISETETQQMRVAGFTQSFFLPAFVPFDEVSSEEGVGNFCLYHGNLSVPENRKAACWLLEKVFSRIRTPLVVAGKNPGRRLRKYGHLCQHTCLVANPSGEEMKDLVRKAHINILPSFSTSGTKLKLLHALFEGRHCVTTEEMVAGTGLEPACHTASSPAAMAAIVVQLQHQPFSMEEVLLRKKLLGDRFSNEKNAKALTRYLW
jgi:hypothetical protein